MVNRLCLAVLVLLFTPDLRSQNLILNPGLETSDPAYELPVPPVDTFDFHNIPGWFNPGNGTTDYFNCDGKHSHCGSRFFGKDIKAHSGTGYAGIYIEKSRWKEYIGVQLSETLQAGKNYRLSMWLALSPKSKYAMPSLQVEFWNIPFVEIASATSDYPRSNPKYPSIFINGTARSSIIGNWTQFSVDFTAIGGEVSFVLGFLDDYWKTVSLPETVKNKNNIPYCYYFIDDVELTPLIGPPIPRPATVRPVIYFDTDKDVIKKEFFSPLDSVAEKMKSDALLKLQINGFTDSVGNVQDNLELSMRRAESVKKYLEGKGVDPARMTISGFAESRPAAEENARNRRVEFVYIR